MTINEASGITPYRQVATALRDEIARGKYATGERIPSTRELSDQFGVALTTAVKAIDELREEGVIETRRGLGSFVKRTPELRRFGGNRYRRNSEGLAPNRVESAQGGWIDHVDATIWDTVAAPRDIAERLNIAPGEPVSVARYLWTVEGEPFQVSTQYEPLAITAGTAIERPVDGTRGNPGVISRFDSIGIFIDSVAEETRARMPSTEEFALLQLGPSVPVLHITRTHLAGETAVETADIVIRSDRMVITTTHDVPLKDR